MTSEQLVVFTTKNLRIGIHTRYVERVVPACEVSALPNAPSVVLGVVDLHGVIAPVFDVGARFGQADTGVRPNDIFIVCNTPGRTVVLAVNSVAGLQGYSPDSVIAAEDILPGLPHIEGAIRISDDVVLIHDLSKFLSIEEEQSLSNALKETEA